MTRKEFLTRTLFAGVVAAVRDGTAAANGAVGRPFVGWTPGHFQIHSIYTGCGEQLFLIFPDSTTMLLDGGDGAAMTRGDLACPILPREPYRLGGDWVARYVARVNPNGRNADYMVLSHWHSDHGGTPFWCTAEVSRKIHWWSVPYKRSGFGIALEDLKFARSIDRGYPDYDDPIPQDTPDHTGRHWRDILAYLRKRDGLVCEKLRLGATDQIVPLRGEVKGFSVFNLCANGKIAFPDGRVVDCYADRLAANPRPTYLNENGMSLGMIFTYGKFRFYTAGDFSDRWKRADGTEYWTEDTLAEAVPPCQVAKLNHHGHWSMTEKLVRALRSRVWLSCVWDVLHNVAPVMERLSDERLYPGERLICPGVFPARRQREDTGKPWLGNVAPASFDGGHVVVDVQPGGERYSVSYLTAADESMRVVSQYEFES